MEGWLPWLKPGAQFSHVSRHGAHQLASLQSVSQLSQAKLQGLLYPMDQLEAYLDASVDKSRSQPGGHVGGGETLPLVSLS